NWVSTRIRLASLSKLFNAKLISAAISINRFLASSSKALVSTEYIHKVPTTAPLFVTGTAADDPNVPLLRDCHGAVTWSLKKSWLQYAWLSRTALAAGPLPHGCAGSSEITMSSR